MAEAALYFFGRHPQYRSQFIDFGAQHSVHYERR
jgi:hypothetical protein